MKQINSISKKFENFEWHIKLQEKSKIICIFDVMVKGSNRIVTENILLSFQIQILKVHLKNDGGEKFLKFGC